MRCETGRIDTVLTEQVLHDAGLPVVAQPTPPEAQPVAGEHNALRPLWQQVAELERVAIAQALEASGGNKQAAARLLGISRAKLYAGLMPEKNTTV